MIKTYGTEEQMSLMIHMEIYQTIVWEFSDLIWPWKTTPMLSENFEN